MQTIADEDTLSIAPYQLISVRLEQEQMIRVASGRVWITIESDANDYWLAAGQTMVLPRDRHIVIEAGAEHGCIDMLPQPLKPPAAAHSMPTNAKLMQLV